jgi:DNA-binding transcriptional LysR family regulator
VVEQLLTGQLGDIRLAMELGGTEAIKRAVEAGIGISCLSLVALAGAIERGNLVAVDTPFLTLKRTLHIVLHKQKYRTDGIEVLLALCETAQARA